MIMTFFLGTWNVVLISVSASNEYTSGLQPWIDWNYTQVALFEGQTSSVRQWSQLGATTMIWIVVPLVVGLLMLRRSEVK